MGEVGEGLQASTTDDCDADGIWEKLSSLLLGGGNGW